MVQTSTTPKQARQSPPSKDCEDWPLHQLANSSILLLKQSNSAASTPRLVSNKEGAWSLAVVPGSKSWVSMVLGVLKIKNRVSRLVFDHDNHKQQEATRCLRCDPASACWCCTFSDKIIDMESVLVSSTRRDSGTFT